MRILALHPWGTSAQLFERQMAPLASVLGTTHEFVYVNGPVDGIKAQGVPDFVQGPFYRWYEGLSSANVQEAHDVIFDVIDDEGPFDGVLGFSQGASLVLSMLLHHEIHHPAKPPPFRFAILLCSVVVISPDPNFNAKYIAKYRKYYKGIRSESSAGDKANHVEHIHGEDESEHEIENKVPEDTGAVTASKNGKKGLPKPKPAPKHRGMLLLRSQREALTNELVELVEDLTALNEVHDHHGDKWQEAKAEEFPRIFHPLTVKERVSIPTVHVYGKDDPIAKQSALGVRLCDKKNSKTIVFDGDHAGPSSLTDLRAVAAAIEWAMQKSLCLRRTP